MSGFVDDPRVVFVVMVDDHNFDTQAHLFSERAAALAFAREFYEAWRPDDLTDAEIEEHGIGEEDVPGWLYSATYSTEGDTVWVVEKTLDALAPAGTLPRCLYCTRDHGQRWLCDQGKRVLDAMIARGMEMNMPTLEFPEPIPMDQQPGLGQVDALLAQLVVMGATVDIAGRHQPALMFTGVTAHGERMPRYLYPGGDDDLRRASQLVSDMTVLAIRTAAEANRGR